MLFDEQRLAQLLAAAGGVGRSRTLRLLCGWRRSAERDVLGVALKQFG